MSSNKKIKKGGFASETSTGCKPLTKTTGKPCDKTGGKPCTG